MQNRLCDFHINFPYFQTNNEGRLEQEKIEMTNQEPN
jgi:hypothetical protein